jgi:DNA-binding HxlR family transcriptional regulator
LQEDLATFAVDPGVESRVRYALTELGRALEAEPKPASWRLRAKIGTRVPWRNLVEEQE